MTRPEAKDLLTEAGYPNGFDAVIRLPPPVYARRGGEIIAAQLAEVGVRLGSSRWNGRRGWNRCSGAGTTT